MTECDVDYADSLQDSILKTEATQYDLILVNRILDTCGGSGLDVVKQLVGSGSPVMLVSNFAEAQTQAVASGARAGFGKSELREPATGEKILNALSQYATEPVKTFNL